MKNPQAIFREYCERKGLRRTSERQVIIDEIYREHGHFDVDSLFLRIRNRHPKIKLSKVSIYRTMPHLIRAGLVRKSFTEKGHHCYEHNLGHGHHDHMRCLQCGRTFEFYAPEIDKIQRELCKKRGFHVVSHIHVIEGYCPNCQKKRK